MPAPDTSIWEAPSAFQHQKDSAGAVLKRAGKAVVEALDDMVKRALGDTTGKSRDPEILHQQIRLHYIDLTRDIKVPVINAWNLKQIYKDSNVILVDVREEREQNISMIPGAITPHELARDYKKVDSIKDKTVVTYCTIGYRSGLYAMDLQTMNIKVLNLQGGILAWTHIDGPLIKQGAGDKIDSTKQVHVYDSSWNFAHPSYESKWKP